MCHCLDEGQRTAKVESPKNSVSLRRGASYREFEMTKTRASVELAKVIRRGRIIDAAEDLIRSSGNTNFSMNSLARHAGLSTNTTYNLIGSKAAVLYTLLNRSVESIGSARLASTEHRDPLASLLHAGDTAVAVFTSEPTFYRPLLRFLFSAEEPGPRAEFMRLSQSYWTAAAAPLDNSDRLVASGLKSNDLARDLLIFFTGATEFWVHDELSADAFRAQIQHGISLRLLCVADEHETKGLIRNISDARLSFDAPSALPDRWNLARRKRRAGSVVDAT